MAQHNHLVGDAKSACGRHIVQVSAFQKFGAKTDGTFSVTPISTVPVGDELVVTHARNSMNVLGNDRVIDAVVVWRIVNGHITEAWDIPSIYTMAHAA